MIEQHDNILSSKFDNFVREIKWCFEQEYAQKITSFTEFIVSANKEFGKTKEQSIAKFAHFIIQNSKIVIDEVETWSEDEKAIFELLFRKNDINVFEAFSTESPYRDFFVVEIGSNLYFEQIRAPWGRA